MKLHKLILELIKMIERNSEFTVNVLRSDNGTEFKIHQWKSIVQAK